MASLDKIVAVVFFLPLLFAFCGGARVKLTRKKAAVAPSVYSESNQESTAGECEMSTAGHCKIYASAGSDPVCKELAGTYYWKVPDTPNTFRIMPKKYTKYTPGVSRDGMIVAKSEVPDYEKKRYPEEFGEKVGEEMLPHPDKEQYITNLLIPGWEESSPKVVDPAECMRVVCMGLGTKANGPSLSELLKLGGGRGNLHAGKLGESSASGGWVVTEKKTGALVACAYQDETSEGSRQDHTRYSFTVRGPLVDSWTFADDADVSPSTDILAPVTLKAKVGATMGMGDGIDELWESELSCEDGAWHAKAFVVHGTGGGGGRTFDSQAQALILPHIPKSMNGKGPELPPYRST